MTSTGSEMSTKGSAKKNLRAAKMHVVTIQLTCPECGEYIASKLTGSHSFTEDDATQLGGTTQCWHCKTVMRFPKSVEKLWRDRD